MFIRTKDRIYELKDNGKYGDLIKTIGLDNFHSQNYKPSDKLADLCDAYVFVSESGKTHYIYGFDYDMGVKINGSRIESDEIFRNHLLENGTIYGAIFTDKGLIYVAKMNDDGELELI